MKRKRKIAQLQEMNEGLFSDATMLAEKLTATERLIETAHLANDELLEAVALVERDRDGCLTLAKEISAARDTLGQERDDLRQRLQEMEMWGGERNLWSELELAYGLDAEDMDGAADVVDAMKEILVESARRFSVVAEERDKANKQLDTLGKQTYKVQMDLEADRDVALAVLQVRTEERDKANESLMVVAAERDDLVIHHDDHHHRLKDLEAERDAGTRRITALDAELSSIAILMQDHPYAYHQGGGENHALLFGDVQACILDLTTERDELKALLDAGATALGEAAHTILQFGPRIKALEDSAERANEELLHALEGEEIGNPWPAPDPDAEVNMTRFLLRGVNPAAYQEAGERVCLRSALKEAMQHNWIPTDEDEEVPAEVIKRCLAALNPVLETPTPLVDRVGPPAFDWRSRATEMARRHDTPADFPDAPKARDPETAEVWWDRVGKALPNREGPL